MGEGIKNDLHMTWKETLGLTICFLAGCLLAIGIIVAMGMFVRYKAGLDWHLILR